MKAYQTRIVKIEKGQFFIEYKDGRWSDWKMIDKTFKTTAKAQEYIIKNIEIVL